MEGNIIVGGELASCYGSYNHDFAHFAITPIQWFPQIMQWIFGEDNGFQTYVIIAVDLGRWALPHGHSFEN